MQYYTLCGRGGTASQQSRAGKTTLDAFVSKCVEGGDYSWGDIAIKGVTIGGGSVPGHDMTRAGLAQNNKRCGRLGIYATENIPQGQFT